MNMYNSIDVIHINYSNGPGGASRLCSTLHETILSKGYSSEIHVGKKYTDSKTVVEIKNDRYRNAWARTWLFLAKAGTAYKGSIPGLRWSSKYVLPYIALPGKLMALLLGKEYLSYPGTYHILDEASFIPSILHLHNLHGNYFDIRAIPMLSSLVPTVVTLHDAWMLAGHCAHSFDCSKWKTGCIGCNYLDTPPRIRRDGASSNWQMKKDIYKRSNLSLVCPSNWLASKVRESILMESCNNLTVIPNGVDVKQYKPGNMEDARRKHDLPQDAFLVGFAANTIRKSAWKDYDTMKKAVAIAGKNIQDRKLMFVALGENAPAESAGAADIVFMPYREDIVSVYQAMDVYIHAAKAEVWGLTITEALASGKPVVATSVGGIPEQIVDGKTGFLVPAGDAAALAERLVLLEKSPNLVRSMGQAARVDAVAKFSKERMVESYIELYQNILSTTKQ